MPTDTLNIWTTHSGSRKLESGDAGPLRSDRVDVWFLSLDQDAGTLERSRAFLSREEIARSERYIHEIDAKRYILAHGLMRALLAEATGQHPEKVAFTFGKYKKPYVAGEYDVQFNLSDTKDALIIAMTSGEELGADIETMDRKVHHEDVADHYFTEAEKKIIFENKENGKRRFLEFWTKKEALLKASGVGIMDDLKLLDTSKEHITIPIKHSEFREMAEPEYHIECFEYGEKHLLSIARSSEFKLIRLLSAEGLL